MPEYADTPNADIAGSAINNPGSSSKPSRIADSTLRRSFFIELLIEKFEKKVLPEGSFIVVKVYQSPNLLFKYICFVNSKSHFTPDQDQRYR